MRCSVFNLPFQIAIYTRVITETMLFLQFNFVVILCWYGIQKNEYHKFGIKHVVNFLTLNCLSFPHCLYLYFMQACINWVLIIFGIQVIKKKRPVRPVFPDYLSVSYGYELTKYDKKYTKKHGAVIQLRDKEVSQYKILFFFQILKEFATLQQEKLAVMKILLNVGAAVRKCSTKQVFLNILHNLHRKTSGPDSFDEVVRRRPKACYFIKKEALAQVAICKILKNTFFQNSCGRLLLDVSEC